MTKQTPPRVYLSGCFRLTEEYASPAEKFRVLSVEPGPSAEQAEIERLRKRVRSLEEHCNKMDDICRESIAFWQESAAFERGREDEYKKLYESVWAEYKTIAQKENAHEVHSSI